jgi:hypothetical protein
MPIRLEQPAPLDAEAFARFARRQSGGDDGRLAVAQAAAQNDFFRAAAATAGQRADAGNMQFAAAHAQDRLQEGQRQFDIEQANQFALQKQRAELAAWVNDRDMTQAEEAQYRRDEAAIGAVMADRTLAPWEKEEIVLSKRSGVDMARRRLEATQQRAVEARMREDAAQAEHVTQLTQKQSAFMARSFEDRTRWVVDPATRAELEAQFPEPQNRAEADLIEKEIVRRAAKAGKAAMWYEKSPGQWEKDDVKAAKEADERDDEIKNLKVVQERIRSAQKEAAAAVPVDKDEETGLDKNAKAREEYFARVLDRLGGVDVGKKQAAGSDAPNAPPDPRQVRQTRAKAIEAMNEITAGLPEADRAAVQGLLGRARGLMEAGLTPETEPEYVAALAEVARMIQKAKGQKAGAAAGQQSVLSGRSGEVSDRPRVRRLGE